MLIDSHCHLDRLNTGPFNNSFEQLMAVAREAGIDHILCVCINLESYPSMVALVEQYPDISISAGVHPNDKANEEPDAQRLIGLAEHEKNVAIGETGLDYYRSEGDLNWQRDRFRTHIQAAKTCGKPLIIHTRAARSDTIAIMQQEGARDACGVMHCFSENWDMARKALDMGFYISFSGIITFKNADDLRSVVKKIPEDRILIETDAPYLTPAPHRGKPNLPQYVTHVAECVAELRGKPKEEMGNITADNFYQLFPKAR